MMTNLEMLKLVKLTKQYKYANVCFSNIFFGDETILFSPAVDKDTARIVITGRVKGEFETCEYSFNPVDRDEIINYLKSRDIDIYISGEPLDD